MKDINVALTAFEEGYAVRFCLSTDSEQRSYRQFLDALDQRGWLYGYALDVLEQSVLLFKKEK